MLASLLLELSFREMVSDIPHDFSAFVVYSLLALLVALTWFGSRGSARRPTDGGVENAS